MAMREITVTIEAGNATVETDGFMGHGCEAVVKGIAAALGNAGASITHKREFNAPTLTDNRLRQGK
jgi:hypothetical protein